MSALRDGLTPRRLARLHELFGICRRTLERWRGWWLETFVETDLWRIFRGRFAPPVEEADLPRALLARFGSLGSKRGLVGMLGLLAPLGASVHARRGAIFDPQRMQIDSNRGGP